MFNLPQITEEDVQTMDAALGELIEKCGATTVLITDVGGAMLTKKGDLENYDTTSIAALASNSFNATQMIASLINEPNFSSVYQQGDRYSLLVANVADYCLLIIIFKATISVGMVKFYSAETVRKVAAQMKTAAERAPGETLDLVEMNIADVDELFKRRKSESGSAQ